MIDLDALLPGAVIGITTGILMAIVRRSTVKKERQRRYLEDVEKGMEKRHRKNAIPDLVHTDSKS